MSQKIGDNGELQEVIEPATEPEKAPEPAPIPEPIAVDESIKIQPEPEPEPEPEPKPEPKPEPIKAKESANQPESEPSNGPVNKVHSAMVDCSSCSVSYDFGIHGRVCPNCTYVRRGRPPKGIKEDKDIDGVKVGGSGSDSVREGVKKQVTPGIKKPKFTLEDMTRPLSDMELQMADMPVMAVHAALSKKRGYGLTKTEADAGRSNFGYLVRKYKVEIFEYMPEIMCVVWIAKCVMMPEVTPQEWARMNNEIPDNVTSIK